MLKVERLNAYYGRARILFDVSFDVAPGEVVALMGRNGAGKSTTLKAISGMLTRKSDDVFFNDVNISNLPSYKISRLGLGWVPEDRRIFTHLSVAENLQVGRQGARLGSPTWTVSQLLEIFPNLSGMMNRQAIRTSGGVRAFPWSNPITGQSESAESLGYTKRRHSGGSSCFIVRSESCRLE